jgi:cytochrome bd-type quinol oxidase subunit 2
MVYAVDIRDVFPLAKIGGRETTIGDFTNILFPFLTTVGALLFLSMLLIGAFTMITAGGDTERVKKAQQTMKYAVLGIVIVLVAYTIVQLVSSIFGINSVFK